MIYSVNFTDLIGKISPFKGRRHIEIVGEILTGKRPFVPSCESFAVIE